ncbi:MAG: beta-hydroxyacyl-ACP dehydratase [Planctomycetaceae bacterium]|nr:beta-hydroxyacyl-ACP dehydratase [Planctomycetaceae bacterium]
MVKKDLILDFSEYDVNNVVLDLAQIRSYNRQRFEMEQLTAVCFEDPERQVAVGYKDLSNDEFWVRGHMPGMPLLPGVVMCEIAAQLCSCYSQRYGLLGNNATLGFGGMNEVRFRGVVVPGQRLVVVCQAVKVRKGILITSRFQAFVERNLVGEGEILGVALPADSVITSAKPTP